MKIQAINTNTNFGTTLDTAKMLEVTSGKIFRSIGTDGWRDVVNALRDEPITATGYKGYRYFAGVYGEKICKKYPKVAQATEEVNKIFAECPNAPKEVLNQRIQPIIDRLGETIDIVV